MSQVKVCSLAGSIKNARDTHSAQFAFHSHETHIIMGRHIASIADSVCTGISNGAGRERRAKETTTTTREILSPRRAKEKRRREGARER